VWALWQFVRAGGAGSLVLAVIFALAAAALTYYFRHLSRFLGR
jgi:hypothetical protein